MSTAALLLSCVSVGAGLRLFQLWTVLTGFLRQHAPRRRRSVGTADPMIASRERSARTGWGRTLISRTPRTERPLRTALAVHARMVSRLHPCRARHDRLPRAA